MTVFTTATAGLEEVSSPHVLRLRDGDRLDLGISPVRKSLNGADLRMLAYNGSVPGPTLHVKQGSQITVHTRNDGDVETTVHWHGLRLENHYDGVPHETQLPIPIGGSYSWIESPQSPASTQPSSAEPRVCCQVPSAGPDDLEEPAGPALDEQGVAPLRPVGPDGCSAS